MAKVDTSGAEAKFKLLQKKANRDFPKLLVDAAEWIRRRMVDEVLNGQAGTNYPKSYPSSVSEGQKGFVGIDTSQLRGSVDNKAVTPFLQVVASFGVNYEEGVRKWSKEKYGIDFYEITVKLYGPTVAKKMHEFVDKVVRDANARKATQYRNPFPA